MRPNSTDYRPIGAAMNIASNDGAVAARLEPSMKLLHIDSSALGTFSVTRELTAAAVAQYRERNPDVAVSYRDLAADPLPHWTPIGGDPSTLTPELRAQAERNEEILVEFLAADVI
ncbi:MAG TPA: NAD(P)H-dependent oxidoreductase, partial [Tahibacter sp.]|nr:NAD(P)H-dependent oxidoreductase [Tahibacter sp.]